MRVASYVFSMSFPALSPAGTPRVQRRSPARTMAGGRPPAPDRAAQRRPQQESTAAERRPRDPDAPRAARVRVATTVAVSEGSRGGQRGQPWRSGTGGRDGQARSGGTRPGATTDPGPAGADGRPGDATTAAVGSRGDHRQGARPLDHASSSRGCPRSSPPGSPATWSPPGMLIDEDPKTAYQHTLAARARAARLAVVREACGEAAYAAGEYAEALAELRAAKRMNGTTDYLPIMADCERALGPPGAGARPWPSTPAVANLAARCKAEMTIVEAGARRDLGRARRRAAHPGERPAALKSAGRLGGPAALRLRRHPAGRRPPRGRARVVPPHRRDRQPTRSPTRAPGPPSSSPAAEPDLVHGCLSRWPPAQVPAPRRRRCLTSARVVLGGGADGHAGDRRAGWAVSRAD